MNASDILSVIILLGLVPIAVIWAIGQYQEIKHKERMAMIEKGIGTLPLDKKENPFHDVLLWALLAIGIGFGLLTGFLLIQNSIVKDDAIMGILAILFGGIGALVYTFYKKSSKNK
jgi:polyferredoxin